MELRFFDPYADFQATHHWLPHWQQPGACLFLTFRLADAVPKELLDRWRDEREAWLRFHPEPWPEKVEREYHERFSGAVKRWLDAGHGACVLRQPECSRIVANALGHFDRERYGLHSWVVMPNHVHALLSLAPGSDLPQLVRSWKTFAARGINARTGRSGTLWQHEYFDRIVRDARHFANCVRYIRRNPTKANLRDGEYRHGENEVAKAIEG